MDRVAEGGHSQNKHKVGKEKEAVARTRVGRSLAVRHVSIASQGRIRSRERKCKINSILAVRSGTGFLRRV
jgi:hypothetical protein